ncbi:MAG: GNAT family N-acetyltransferase [Actinomycetaceae bacterium]|nr:GNAT family N-acetyltransferase [Actinomycetaceae bacterium]
MVAQSQDNQSLHADVSVRPAVASDAQRIGTLHAAALTRYIAHAAPESVGVAQGEGMESQSIGAQWMYSISYPPSQYHQILAAYDHDRLVGFAAFGPPEGEDIGTDVRADTAPSTASDTTVPAAEHTASTSGKNQGSPGQPARAHNPTDTLELIALEVDQNYWRQGHGSRLLNACADIAKELGATRLQIWLHPADDQRLRFYSDAGFGPDVQRRAFSIGDTRLDEHLWFALLDS